MKKSETLQSEAEINAFKVAKIVIDIGTPLSQSFLEDYIITNMKYGSIEKFFKKKNIQKTKYVKKAIQEWKNKNSTNNPPNSLNVKLDENKFLFDISNCFEIARTLTDLIPKEEARNEIDYQSKHKTPGSCLNNLRNIRNICYAHLTVFKIDTSSFQKLCECLEVIISTLSKNNTSDFLDQYNTILNYNQISLDDFNKYRNDIEYGIINHLNDILEFFSKISSENKSIMEQIEKLKNSNEENYENVKNLLNELMNKIKSERIIEKNLANQINEMKIELRECSTKIESKIEENGKSVIGKIDQATSILSDQICKSTEQIINTALGLNSNIKIKDICSEKNLQDLKEYFEEEYKDCFFRMLILDSEECDFSIVKKKELVDSIGSIDWNIIIEITSKNNNNLDRMEMEICQNSSKNFKRNDLSSLKNILDSDWDNIFRDDYLFYLTLSSDDNDDTFFQLKQDLFEKFPKDTLKNTEIVCFNYMLRRLYQKENFEYIDKLIEALRESFIRKKREYGLKEDKCLEIIYLIPNDLQNLKDIHPRVSEILSKNKNHAKIFCCLTPHRQITKAMLEFGPQNQADKYYLPGSEGKVEWTKEYQRNYSHYFEVYHTEIGKFEKPVKSEREEKYNKIISDFIILRNDIKPETIYLNDELKEKSFVEMNLINKLKDEITNNSKKTEFFIRNKRVFKIKHLPSCGGTTIAKILLYRLKNELPCILLKKFDINEDLFLEGLRIISRDTDLPVVILIDSDSIYGSDSETFDDKRITEFSKMLQINETIKHFLICPQRIFSEKDDMLELNEDQIDEYREFFKKFEKYQKNGERFLYCLNFLNIRLDLLQIKKKNENTNDLEAKLMEKLSKNYIANFDDNEMRLLIVLYYLNKSADTSHLDSDIASAILKIENIEHRFTAYAKNKIAAAKTIFHLLKFEPKKGFKFLNYQLVQKLCEFLTIKVSKYQNVKLIQSFYDILFDLLKDSIGKNDTILMEELIKLLKVIIADRNLRNSGSEFIEEQDDPEDTSNVNSRDEINIKNKKFYSDFIIVSTSEIGETITKENLIKVKGKIEEINSKLKYKCTQIPFIKVTIARYIFHQCKNEEEGIKHMKEALNIEKSLKDEYSKLVKNCQNSSDLLTNYGDIFRHYMNFRIKKFDALKKNIPHLFDLAEIFNQVLEIAKEASYAYKNAIKIDRNNALARLGECKLNKNFLFFYCDDYEEISKFETKQDEFINDLMPSIITNMNYLNDKLDYLSKFFKNTNDFERYYDECYYQTYLKLKESELSFSKEIIKKLI